MTAGDPDAGDTLTYAIVGGTGAFAIDENSGEITVADVGQLDIETTSSFDLSVEVTDAEGLVDTAVVKVDLDPINETPVVDDQSFSVAENSANGTVVGTVAASDPDAGDTLTYAIVGGTGAFAIDGGSGQIAVTDTGQLDFETTPSFDLAVEVKDVDGLVDAAIVTVGLSDVVE